MALNNYKLGDLLMRNSEENKDLIYGISDVRGVRNTKGISNTKIDVSGRNLKTFLVVRPGGFIFNHRVHDKLGLGYNTSDETYIFTNDYVSFYVKPEVKNRILLPDYLYMWYLRPEFDRYMLFKTYGSATLFFSWDNMCELEIELPDLPTQQKYVDVYNAMVANQQAYERGLEDLKLTCDAYIEDLRRKMPCEKIGRYIERHDIRNGKNGSKNVMGISTSKQFREPTSKVNKNELANYKVCHPRQIGFVQTTHNEKVFTYAFNNAKEDIVVSSVNEVFSTQEDKLYPEYLCMFFNRTEFDRYARFHSWGSARETFTWNDLIEVKIPIPDIAIQKSIAEMYTVYNKRKKINEQLKAQIKNICPILIRGSLEDGGEPNGEPA